MTLVMGEGLSESGPSKRYLDYRQEWMESGTLSLVSYHAEDTIKLGFGWCKAGIVKFESF